MHIFVDVNPKFTHLDQLKLNWPDFNSFGPIKLHWKKKMFLINLENNPIRNNDLSQNLITLNVNVKPLIFEIFTKWAVTALSVYRGMMSH